jgi:uncharacterized protein YdeI (YjbR/CyaY-like superfamily)
MGHRDPRFDEYIARAQPFARPILTYIREAVHAGCPEVEETIKWRNPTFRYKGILCGMAAFKGHAAFGFWKASAMDGVSRKATEAAGQFGRITSIDDLPSKAALVKLVRQAVALHDAGVKAPRIKTAPKKPLKAPADLVAALRKNAKAKKTYGAFSPSAKREYVEWITGAKGEETRQRRVATAIEWMAAGKQRNWKYM